MMYPALCRVRPPFQWPFDEQATLLHLAQVADLPCLGSRICRNLWTGRRGSAGACLTAETPVRIQRVSETPQANSIEFRFDMHALRPRLQDL